MEQVSIHEESLLAMKKIYWRPQGMPLAAFILIAVIAIGGLLLVEHFQFTTKRPAYHRDKLAASQLAMKAMEMVRNERLARGPALDDETDPAGSGLIGSALTPVTSDVGDLEAKQTSVNPNFAAVFVELLKRAKLREGDPVAVGVTGSFPALNISLYAAMATLRLKPVIISSVGASQWGANDPLFLWVDMESVLYRNGVFPFRSVGASMGGKNDRAREMTAEGRKMIADGIKRNELEMVKARNLEENIEGRMGIYFAHGAPRAYVNVGGGVASAGTRSARILLKPGNLPDVPEGDERDSVIRRFLKEKIPVIHVENIRQLAREYGLPVGPGAISEVGHGGVYYEKKYNRWLAGGVLVLILVGLYIFGRLDWGFRMLRASKDQDIGPPEQMV
jgi:poly-gamma-glutamate system protein